MAPLLGLDSSDSTTASQAAATSAAAATVVKAAEASATQAAAAASTSAAGAATAATTATTATGSSSTDGVVSACGGVSQVNSSSCASWASTHTQLIGVCECIVPNLPSPDVTDGGVRVKPDWSVVLCADIAAGAAIGVFLILVFGYIAWRMWKKKKKAKKQARDDKLMIAASK